MSWRPLVLSLEIAAFATIIAGALGLGAAIALSRRRFFGCDLLDALCTAPMVMPPTVLGYYVLVLFGRHGAIGKLFESITGGSIVFTQKGAVIAAAIGSFPLVVKSARTALESVDRELVGVARTLGASPSRALFAIELPLAMRGLVAGLTLAMARALGDFGLTLMVAGDIPGETQTASLAIYDALQSNADAQAGAMIVLLTATSITALWGINKLLVTRHG
jgi:molybdate transport system permease protein